MNKTWRKPLTIAIHSGNLFQEAHGREWMDKFFKCLNRPAIWAGAEPSVVQDKLPRDELAQDGLRYTLVGPRRIKDAKDPELLALHFADEADLLFVATDNQDWREAGAEALLTFEAGEGGPLGKMEVAGAEGERLKKKSFESPASLAAEMEFLGWEKSKQLPIKGLVLAGGKSSRMGRDKSRLSYHGRPQWQVAMEWLRPFCQSVYLSGRDSQSVPEEAPERERIYDTFLNKGPLGGILSAQEKDPRAAWLVLACDLPHVTEAVLDHLISKRDPLKLATAFRSSHDGLPEPLCALYEPRSHGRLLRFLSAGISCPRKALIHSNVRLLDLPDAGALNNINYPEEYEASLKDIRSRT